MVLVAERFTGRNDGREKGKQSTYEVRMSEIGRNGTWGNESDCVRIPARVSVVRERERERRRTMSESTRCREGERGKREVVRGDTRVSKDVVEIEREMRRKRARETSELMRVRSERAQG